VEDPPIRKRTENGDEIKNDRSLGEALLKLRGIKVRSLRLGLSGAETKFAGFGDRLIFYDFGIAGSIGEGERSRDNGAGRRINIPPMCGRVVQASVPLRYALPKSAYER
jgi:hypothetical protein